MMSLWQVPISSRISQIRQIQFLFSDLRWLIQKVQCGGRVGCFRLERIASGLRVALDHHVECFIAPNEDMVVDAMKLLDLAVACIHSTSFHNSMAAPNRSDGRHI